MGICSAKEPKHHPLPEIPEDKKQLKGPVKTPSKPVLTKAKTKSEPLPDELHRAASSIQRKFKKLVGQVMAQRSFLLYTWNELDKKEERELQGAHNDYLKLKQMYLKNSRGLHSLKNFDDEKKSITETVDACLVKVKEQAKYQERSGWHNGFQIAQVPILLDDQLITRRFIEKTIDQFKQDKILAYENAYQILKRVFPILKEQENVVYINFEEDQQVTIVGDLHGQLDDLLTIFQMNGFPSEDNIYIFNGDFVDRGQNSAEIVLLLFALKVLSPDYVHLNRGNHESKDMNSMDGFEREILDKYNGDMFNLFSEIFGCLSLAAVVQEKVFVVHAGLAWDDIVIQDLLDLNRFHAIPPDKSIMQSLLWSDPVREMGRHISRRGAGVQFGADVCETFLKKNKLDIIIRSHECVDEGYEMWFDDQLITIFSASNYCGDTGNCGAFMTITSKLEKKILQFEASRNVRKTLTTRDEQLKKSIISKLIRRISLHRLDLMTYWDTVADSSGKISRVHWSHGLNACLDLQQVPFLHFQEALGLMTKVGDRIDYKTFLSKYRPAHSDLDRAIEPPPPAAHPHGHGHGPGHPVDKRVGLGIGTMGGTAGIPGGPGSASTSSGTSSIISGSSGSSGDKKQGSGGSRDGVFEDVKGGLRDSLNQLLFSRRFQLESLFRHFDINKDGSITLEEFSDGIHALMSVMGKDFEVKEIRRLMEVIDKDGNGEIDYQEFLEAFAPCDPFISAQILPSGGRQPSGSWMDGVFTGGQQQSSSARRRDNSAITFHTSGGPKLLVEEDSERSVPGRDDFQFQATPRESVSTSTGGYGYIPKTKENQVQFHEPVSDLTPASFASVHDHEKKSKPSGPTRSGTAGTLPGFRVHIS